MPELRDILTDCKDKRTKRWTRMRDGMSDTGFRNEQWLILPHRRRLSSGDRHNRKGQPRTKQLQFLEMGVGI